MTRLIVHICVNVQAVICDQNFQPVPHRKHHMASETRNIEHTDYFYYVFFVCNFIPYNEISFTV